MSSSLSAPSFSSAAAGSSSSSLFGNAHADVLQAVIIQDPVAAQHLVTECKNRAKAAVQAKAWPDAIQLYNKAVTVLTDPSNRPSTDSNDSSINYSTELSLLQSNLALCYDKMNQHDQALQAAQRSTDYDPSNVKGWYRLALAAASLQVLSIARDAVERGLQIEPNNKALQKELARITELQTRVPSYESTTNFNGDDTGAASAGMDPAMAARIRTIPKKTNFVEPPNKVNAQNQATTSNSSSAVVENGDDEDSNLFGKSDAVRGYKVVNGKKTTYFHNELSQDAAALIGDIAPKKLDVVSPSNGSQEDDTPSLTENNKTKSAWNKAGTWEERDVTAWAIESLQQALQSTMFATMPDQQPPPPPPMQATVTSCNATGHASVATVRDKKRYIYEFCITVDWKLQSCSNSDESSPVATGSMTFPDVDGTCMVGQPYDVSNFMVKSVPNSDWRPLVEQYVMQGLRTVLHQTIDRWVQTFRDTY